MKIFNRREKTVILVSNCTWYLYNFREELLSELKGKGYNLILLSPMDDYYARVEKYFAKKESLFLVRGSENPILEIITILNLLFIYIKYKPDLVHHFTIKPCIYGGLISRLLGIKYTINHITGLGPSFYSKRLKIKLVNNLLNPFYKYAFNKKDKNLVNIFHNKSDRDYFISRGITTLGMSKIIAGSGVDIEYFQKSNLSKVNRGIKKILFPARIIKEKGIVELIDACKELWDEGYKFNLNIAGEIDTQNNSHISKKTFRYLINNENIFFLGKCNNMLEIYNNIDMVVLPSWREGLSKSLLESAAMSLPIITTNVPGCKDIIKNKYSGLVVRVRNKGKIKSAISLYLNNPKLAYKLGKNARKTVVDKYTVQIINKKILNIYNLFLNK